MAVAAPFPALRIAHQTTLHRIPVQIAQLYRELAVVPDISIVVSLLPEGPCWFRCAEAAQPFGEGQFQVMGERYRVAQEK
jgi:hypothetical protein